MSQLIHKFLADDERVRTILASVSSVLGLILFVIALIAKFYLK